MAFKTVPNTSLSFFCEDLLEKNDQEPLKFPILENKSSRSSSAMSCEKSFIFLNKGSDNDSAMAMDDDDIIRGDILERLLAENAKLKKQLDNRAKKIPTSPSSECVSMLSMIDIQSKDDSPLAESVNTNTDLLNNSLLSDDDSKQHSIKSIDDDIEIIIPADSEVELHQTTSSYNDLPTHEPSLKSRSSSLSENESIHTKNSKSGVSSGSYDFCYELEKPPTEKSTENQVEINGSNAKNDESSFEVQSPAEKDVLKLFKKQMFDKRFEKLCKNMIKPIDSRIKNKNNQESKENFIDHNAHKLTEDKTLELSNAFSKNLSKLYESSSKERFNTSMSSFYKFMKRQKTNETCNSFFYKSFFTDENGIQALEESTLSETSSCNNSMIQGTNSLPTDKMSTMISENSVKNSTALEDKLEKLTSDNNPMDSSSKYSVANQTSCELDSSQCTTIDEEIPISVKELSIHRPDELSVLCSTLSVLRQRSIHGRLNELSIMIKNLEDALSAGIISDVGIKAYSSMFMNYRTNYLAENKNFTSEQQIIDDLVKNYRKMYSECEFLRKKSIVDNNYLREFEAKNKMMTEVSIASNYEEQIKEIRAHSEALEKENKEMKKGLAQYILHVLEQNEQIEKSLCSKYERKMQELEDDYIEELKALHCDNGNINKELIAVQETLRLTENKSKNERVTYEKNCNDFKEQLKKSKNELKELKREIESNTHLLYETMDKLKSLNQLALQQEEKQQSEIEEKNEKISQLKSENQNLLEVCNETKKNNDEMNVRYDEVNSKLKGTIALLKDMKLENTKLHLENEHLQTYKFKNQELEKRIEEMLEEENSYLRQIEMLAQQIQVNNE